MGFNMLNNSLSRIHSISSFYGKLLTSRLSVVSYCQAGEGRWKHTLADKLGIPAKPKKPLTPFFRFMVQVRPRLIEQHPDTSVIEISKKISEQWAKVDATIKTKLESEYQKDVDLYTKAKLEYTSSLTQEQKEALEQVRLKTREERSKRKLKKKAKEFDRPKRPPSSFVLFSLTRASSRGNVPLQEWQAKISGEWKHLDSTTKKKFLDEAKVLQEDFVKKRAIWEEKMISLGHVDVVRTGALIPQNEKKKSNK